MAFLENQTASTLQSVVDQIEAFAVANAGFTALTPVDIGATTTMRIILKGGMYYFFYGDDYTEADFGTFGRLSARMMRVEPTAGNYNDVGTTIDAQRYLTKMSLWGNLNGAYEGLNLYTDGDAVHVVLEVYANVFAHMSLGIVEKIGTWTGGEYLMANNIRNYTIATGFNYDSSGTNTYIFDQGVSSADDATSGICAMYRPVPSGAFNDYRDYPVIGDIGSPINLTQKCYSTGYVVNFINVSFTNVLYRVSPNNVNLRAMLIPIFILNSREEDVDQYHLQARIPSAKFLNIENLSPKEIVDVNWRVYPYTAKFGDNFTEPVSGDYGVAYLRT